MAPPKVDKAWLQELFSRIEPLPSETYGNPDSCIEISIAISLKRIADEAERIRIALQRPPRR